VKVRCRSGFDTEISTIRHRFVAGVVLTGRMSVRRHPGGAEAEPARPAGLRIAVVTETYPPEINGVAGTVARLVEGFLG
jgi:hypothetical protein